MESKVAYYKWHGADQTIGEIIRAIEITNEVLDIGCGTGWVVDALADKGIHSFGVDLDIHALTNGSITRPLVCGSANELPFNDNSFDIIIAKDILEHILYPSIVMKEIARVLRPDGKLWISVPHADSPRFWDDYTHIRPFTLHSLRSLLEDNGFLLDTACFSGTWPGIGLISRLRGYNGIEPVVKLLGQIGIRRQNILAVARKIAT